MPKTHPVTFRMLLLGSLAALSVLTMAAVPAAAASADIALDGVWFIEEADFGYGPNPYYASVHQNGAQVVGILLDPVGVWIYVLGIRTGSVVEGTVHDPYVGQSYGTFRIEVTGPDQLTGESDIDGYISQLRGARVF